MLASDAVQTRRVERGGSSVPAVLELADASVIYESSTGPVRALDGFSASFMQGTSYAVVGRSGSGKSTLLTVLGLLRRPTVGIVALLGEDTANLSERRRAEVRAAKIGVVPQRFHLEPGLDAIGNVMLPWFFSARGESRGSAQRRAKEILDGLEIGALSRRRPHALSGGQRQRVAIARALFAEPTVILADEPTGNLDEETAGKVSATLFSLARTVGCCVIVVTHDRAVGDLAEQTIELVRGRLGPGGPA